MQKKAVILLSGGIDSTTCLALAKQQEFSCYTLSIDYGQKQQIELHAAQKISDYFQVETHKTLKVPLAELGGSALLDPQLAVPAYDKNAITSLAYVPARNTIFLALALGWAEIIGAREVIIGISTEHRSFADCQPQFVTAFQNLAQTATQNGDINIQAPLLHLNKAQIIRRGLAANVDYSMTTSCYQPNLQGDACSICESCVLRKEGFAEAGVADPTIYQN